MRHSSHKTFTGSLSAWLTGAGVGALGAFFLDPHMGRRRRGLLRDQWAHWALQSTKAADTAWRDVRHRAYGSYAELRASLSEQDIPDDILIERIRSQLGKYVAHPSAVNVEVSGGHAILSGSILQGEERALMAAVRSVRGVREVEDLLEVHAAHQDDADWQGESQHSGLPSPSMQCAWTPTTRLLAGGTGGVLMANGLLRRSPGAIVLGTVGFGLFLRAATNLQAMRMLGISSARRGIDLQKTATIYSPVDRVFSLFANPENYPRFTRIITGVRKIAEDHYEKQLTGPMGIQLTLDEIITRCDPHEVIAWKSGPNSDVKYAGIAHFESVDDDTTRVHVKLTYNPPGGVLSHAAARMAGWDPKSFMDDVFVRARSYLETGTQPRDAAEPVEPVI